MNSSNRKALVAHTRQLIGQRTLRWLALSIMASLVLAGVELGVAKFIQLFLQSLGILSVDVEPLPFFGTRTLSPALLAGVLIGIGVVRSCAQFVVSASGNVSMEMINARLRRIAVFEMLLQSDQRYVPASEVNARIGEHFIRASHFAYAGANVLAQVVQALALIALMMLSTTRETVVAMFGLGFVGLIILRINRLNRNVAAKIPKELEAVSRGIERVARNALLVKALRTQRREHARFAASIDRYASHSVRSGFLGTLSTVITPLAGIVLIVVIVSLSKSVLHTPGLVLLSFLYMFMRFVQCIAAATQHLSVCNQYWAQFKTSLDYVATFTPAEINLAMADAETENMPLLAVNDGVRAAAPAITLTDVNFGYAGSERHVLSHLSARAEGASQLAIVGPSGGGKSTLVALLMGIFEPNSGQIQIGGISPKEYFAQPGIRIGYVGAEAFLIAGTIEENLRYGLREARPESELWQALTHARLKATVEALPGKLEYVIGEDGSGLSAGQKQRLCLARALLASPQLLVLDEASANLDEQTEMEIAESLNALRGHATTVLISHRPGILKHADVTLRLGSKQD